MNTNTTVIGLCIPCDEYVCDIYDAVCDAHMMGGDHTDPFHSDYCPHVVAAQSDNDTYVSGLRTAPIDVAELSCMSYKVIGHSDMHPLVLHAVLSGMADSMVYDPVYYHPCLQLV